MYKHTFYYFLSNKKYPEIYILQIYNVFPTLGDESESVEVKIGKDLESGIKAVGNIWSFCQGQPSAKQ